MQDNLCKSHGKTNFLDSQHWMASSENKVKRTTPPRTTRQKDDDYIMRYHELLNKQTYFMKAKQKNLTTKAIAHKAGPKTFHSYAVVMPCGHLTKASLIG